jgi:hypothetical protein
MVRIYDLRGRLIRAWSLGKLAADGFIWDLTAANGRKVGPGAFVLTLTGANQRMAVPLVVN